MTRKCALCKGTNYKRTYSFFSAPKNSEIRKKWQDVIPIANYVVTDDTYVCSKHFRASDIVTHWVSGVPPNVIRIKYKKFRLRNGAIPSLNFHGSNDRTGSNSRFDESDNHNERIADKLGYLIPRENDAEHSSNDSYKTIEPNITFARYINDERNTYFNRSERITASNDSRAYFSAQKNTIDCIDSITENGTYICTGNNFARKHKQKREDEDRSTMMYGNVENRLSNGVKKSPGAEISGGIYSKGEFDSIKTKVDRDAEIFGEALQIKEVDLLQLQTECSRNEKDGGLDNGQKGRRNIGEKKYAERSLELALCNTMLFEDLLEIYTEVMLPRAWTFLVTSKGHATTVVYLSMSMPTNHVPILEKQVYVKSDMAMHCVVGSREIDLFNHDLLRDGKNVYVRALSDIEELINELDRRHVCEGGPNVKNIEEYSGTRIAYMDGGKWRHMGCPLIINNGSSKCSKCVSLTNIFLRKKNKIANNHRGKTMLEVQRMMNSLKKLTRRNQRLEQMKRGFQAKLKIFLKNSEKTVKNIIGSSRMPEIQKLMVKECLKASVVDDKKHSRYSETWIFLCLLLYVESPRMYKYMSINNYMALPSMLTIRTYLIQIKSNPQFYSLFQRSVEPYQPSSNKRDEREPR